MIRQRISKLLIITQKVLSLAKKTISLELSGSELSQIHIFTVPKPLSQIYFSQLCYQNDYLKEQDNKKFRHFYKVH